MISLTNQERKIFIFLMLLFLLGFGLSYYKKSQGPSTCLLLGVFPQNPVRKPLDINNATREELIALPGIAEVTADAIIAYRLDHGYFSGVDELKNIKGISDKKLESLKKYLCAATSNNL